MTESNMTVNKLPPKFLYRLKYFVAVADELHFGRAAKQIHIAQPALSIQIRMLEEDIGFKLFERTGHGIELTIPGHVLLVEGRKLIDKAEDAFRAVQSAAAGHRGRISVGFTGHLVYGPGIHAIRAFRDRFPEAELILREQSYSEQLDALHDRTIQIGLLRLPCNNDNSDVSRIIQDYEVRVLIHEPVFSLLPMKHSFAVGKKVSLGSLAEEKFVLLPRYKEPLIHDLYTRLCRRAGFVPEILQEAHQIHTVVALVAAGLGVSFVPASMARTLRAGVVCLPIDDAEALADLVIMWRRDDHTPLISTFVNTVVEEINARVVP